MTPDYKDAGQVIVFIICPAFFIMGRDPVELAKRAKHKPPAMQVRDECYTKNHLSLIM